MLRPLIITLTFLSCITLSADRPLAGARPNIIVILTDDTGYGDASCTGNPILKTPHIDRLHREGVHFDDFHVSPTCAPSRAALLSGRHEFHNGVTHTIYERERMSLKTTTLAQILKSAGYTTGIFGKWHLGDEPERWPSARGFDEMFIHGAGGIGQTYPGTCGDAPGNTYFDPVILHNGTFEKTSGYCTDVFFNQAEKWIDGVKGKQPFFCWISPNAAHAPLQCPDDYIKKYADKTGPGKPGQNAARFFGMIANIDDNIGRLLEKLSASKLDENTLVIFMNDNGGTVGVPIFNAGMTGAKNTAHNGGSRALSLWRWPGRLKPAACDKLTAHLDVFPTLAEIAGAKIPAEVAAKLEGFSLVPLLENPNAPWHDERMLFTHCGRWPVGKPPEKYGPCSVRYQQYLLFRGKDKWSLFDLKADPAEKNNLAADHADIIAKLDKAYDAWWDQTLPLLENEDAPRTAPKQNPLKALYWKQYAGPGPNNVPPREDNGPEDAPKPKFD